ncbi:MAG: hypothetical protein HY078_12110 [Elusimicrobia bacterium]|nr:hypothetical protein [Elusimicrobiota bacterium]
MTPLLKRSSASILAALAVAIVAGTAGATAFGDFKSNVNLGNLKPFALDIGGVLGGTNFHSGRSLGMPGFDVGVVGTMQLRPDRDDTILRNAGVQRFGIPMIQAEIGLPFNFDVIAHGMSAQGARVFGGGLRYGIHKSGVLSVLPDVAVSVFGDKLNHEFFNATHFSGNVVASFHLPIVHPYVGFGYDVTKATVGAATAAGVVGGSATARGTRLTAGVDVSPIPFLHAYGAYNLLHGLPGIDLGLGFRF